MARLYPDISPQSPAGESPIPAVTDACGSTFHMKQEVRAPYKGVDKYINVLPVVIGDLTIMSSIASEFDNVLDLAMSFSVINAIHTAIDDAREMKDQYRKDGYIESKNNATIGQMIVRAEDYIKKARRIRDFWDDAYVGQNLPQGWPLDVKWYSNCEDKFAPDTIEVLTMTDEGPKMQEVTCPKKEYYDDHEADRILYVQLIQSALLNARCAQEAAAAVGTYNRNKEEYQKTVGAKQKKLQQAAPSGPSPDPIDSTRLAVMSTSPMPIEPGDEPPIEDAPPIEDEPPVVDDEDEEGGLPEPDEGEAKPVAKKKKDNTILIVGAAALGFLMLGRK